MDFGHEDPGNCTLILQAVVNMKKRITKRQRHKAEKSEYLDLLEIWQKELSAAGFNVEILHLTSKQCPLKDSEPAAQFPDHELVVWMGNRLYIQHPMFHT